MCYTDSQINTYEGFAFSGVSTCHHDCIAINAFEFIEDVSGQADPCEFVTPLVNYDEAVDGDLDWIANDPEFDFGLGNNVIQGTSHSFRLSGGTDHDFDVFTFELPAGATITRIEYEYSNVTTLPGTSALASTYRAQLLDGSDQCPFPREELLGGPGSVIYAACDFSDFAGTLSMPLPSGVEYRWNPVHGYGPDAGITEYGGTWDFRLTFVVE